MDKSPQDHLGFEVGYPVVFYFDDGKVRHIQAVTIIKVSRDGWSISVNANIEDRGNLFTYNDQTKEWHAPHYKEGFILYFGESKDDTFDQLEKDACVDMGFELPIKR